MVGGVIEPSGFVAGLPWWLRWYRICLLFRRPGCSPSAGKICWRKESLPTPVFLPVESQGQRSLASYNPWGCKELNVTDRLTLSLSGFVEEKSIFQVNTNLQKEKKPFAKSPRCSDISHEVLSYWRRKWQPTPMFLPGESQGQGSLMGCRLWGHTESDTMKWLSSSTIVLWNNILLSLTLSYSH